MMDAKRKELAIRWHKAFGTTIREAVQEVDDKLEYLSVGRLEHVLSEQERENANAEHLKAAGINEPFVWGRVVKVHQIGDIAVVEYDDDDDGRQFHPYVGGKDSCTSSDSLDDALLVAIGFKHEGPGSRFANYARLMLRMA